jgi:hypothetical protein
MTVVSKSKVSQALARIPFERFFILATATKLIIRHACNQVRMLADFGTLMSAYVPDVASAV